MRLIVFPFLLLAAVVFYVLTVDFGARGLVLGLLVVSSATALTVYLAEFRSAVPARRLPGAIWSLLGYGLRVVLPSFVTGSLRIARAALRPDPEPSGVIVAVRLPDASPEALLVLSMGVTFNPLQQVVHIDEEARVLYVHTAEPPDPDALVKQIRDDFERFVRRATT